MTMPLVTPLAYQGPKSSTPGQVDHHCYTSHIFATTSILRRDPRAVIIGYDFAEFPSTAPALCSPIFHPNPPGQTGKCVMLKTSEKATLNSATLALHPKTICKGPWL